MYSRAKKFSILYLPALFVCMLFLNACENSLDSIKQVTSSEEDKPYSRSTGVDVIYSDSAKVKLHLTAPLMIDFADEKKPYREMPKGVKMIFYDENMGVKGTITADYGIMREKENMIECRKNVVATNAQGEIFKSDELIYDVNQKKVYSNKAVQITMTNGNVMNGTGFTSNDTLYPWHIDNSRGTFHVTENQGQIGQ
ncbi:MAG: Lipopolysaccharide-assembly, LptC-related [Mucilaginibacter sp.]|jgi:LPS export ABC transporter protein LptC|nr:Lipopolysaccharide-assembly, LptC-related [Mucilaginibacter sp.]MDB5015606.1 Lipopolysaccharide-assembly, LptC-related [Mucilaginibacter sp.]MDB5140665.1 Lipopolysaccharide-assembly, LptC-related [Mucilaginibacter sp.]